MSQQSDKSTGSIENFPLCHTHTHSHTPACQWVAKQIATCCGCAAEDKEGLEGEGGQRKQMDRMKRAEEKEYRRMENGNQEYTYG